MTTTTEVQSPQASEKSADKAAEKRALILNPNRMNLREVLRQDWVVNADAGTRIEDVLDPVYWSHMAAQLEPFARIEVLEETGEWMLDLLVINTGRNFAQVHVLHRYELQQRSEQAPKGAGHTVEWKGPQRKWTVIRSSDGQPLQDGLGSKGEANEWLANYQRAIDRT